MLVAAAMPAAADRQPAGHEAHQPARVEHYTRSFAPYAVPMVDLFDQDGNSVALPEFFDQSGPLLLQFIFTTCPGVCPVMSTTFSAAQEELALDHGDARMVSISIDPEHDTPARLREYALRFRADPQWRFLTGPLEDVVRVQKAFDAYRGNKMRHLPATFVRMSPEDPWLRLEGYPSARELSAEVRRLASP